MSASSLPPLPPVECENCSAPILRDAQRCDFCGTAYFISARARFLYITPDEILLLCCPNCYSLVPLAGRCRVCGFILPHATECENCHTIVPLARNCRNCGNLLAEIVRQRDENDTRNSFVREIEVLARRRLTQAGLAVPLLFHQRYDGNLEILVGDRAYPSVNEIPDAAIRQEIQAAVAEWQNRK